MADAEKTLVKLLADIAKEQKYTEYHVDLKPISTGGANYTTALYTATISEPGKEELHLFAKVANIHDDVRKEMPCDLYEIEFFAYNELAKIYNEMQDRYNIPAKDRLVFTKYYGGSTKINKEIIVLENLIAKGFECHDRLKPIDWPYASKAVEMLAKFHALSIALGEENPKKFESIINKYKFSFGDNEGQEEYFKKVIGHAMTVTKEENRGSLQKFMESMSMEKMMELNAPLRRPVLVHGDYRPSNLMHQMNQDGSVEVIPVDLQTLRAGCGVSDLMFFIFSGSDVNFRAKYYTNLLNHYYANVAATLSAAGLNPNAVYPREDFDYEVEKLLPLGMMMAVLILPLVTVDSANAPNMAEGGIVSSFAIERTSDLYSERLNGIIDDGVRWGIM